MVGLKKTAATRLAYYRPADDRSLNAADDDADDMGDPVAAAEGGVARDAQLEAVRSNDRPRHLCDERTRRTVGLVPAS